MTEMPLGHALRPGLHSEDGRRLPSGIGQMPRRGVMLNARGAALVDLLTAGRADVGHVIVE